MMTKKRRAWLYRWLTKTHNFSDKYAREALRCYTAEEDPDTTNEAQLTKKNVRVLVKRIMADPDWKWLRRKSYGGRRFCLRFTGRWRTDAWGGQNGITIPDHPRSRTIHTVVHEMAHTALTGGGHGHTFLQLMLCLSRRFEGLTYANRLETRLRARGAFRRRHK